MSDVTIYRDGNHIVAKRVRILPGGFLNFSGRETRNPRTGQIYNPKDMRNFWFEVPEEFFELFIEENINLKVTESTMPVDEDEERKGRVKVNVSIDKRPAEIFTRVGTTRNSNGEFTDTFIPVTNLKSISLLDDEFFEEADLLLNISRKNPTQHSLYLITGAFTLKHISNPIKDSIRISYPTDEDDEEVPFT